MARFVAGRFDDGGAPAADRERSPYSHTLKRPAVSVRVMGISVQDLIVGACAGAAAPGSHGVPAGASAGPLSPKVRNSSVWTHVARCNQRQRSQNSMTTVQVGNWVDSGRGGVKEAYSMGRDDEAAREEEPLCGAEMCTCAEVEMPRCCGLRFAGGAGADIVAEGLIEGCW